MKTGNYKSGNLLTFFVLSLVVWFYILLRAWKVQFSTDEAATFFMYIQNGNFLPPHATVDANNHLLNSFLTWLCYNLFGSHPFVFRLPNVLAAILYFYFIYRISLLLSTKSAKYLFIGLSLLTHFLLEFFSYSRGYGLSVAFFTGSIYYLLLAVEKIKLSSVAKTLLFLILATLANLNLIFTGMAIVIILLLLPLIHRNALTGKSTLKTSMLTLLVSLPCFFYFIHQSFQIKSASGFYYGSGDGFFPVTVQSLTSMITGQKMIFFAYYAVTLVVGIAIMLFIQLIRRNENIKQQLPAFMFLTLILANWMGSVSIHYFFDVNFQEDRAALHFLPLFFGMLVFSFDRWARQPRQFYYILLLPLALIPIHSLNQVSLSKTVYGPGQQVPNEFFRYIETQSEESDYPPIISSYQIKRQTWAFMNHRKGGLLNPLYVSDHPWKFAGFIFEKDSLPADFKDLYAVALTDPHTKSFLYERINRPSASVLYSSFPDKPLKSNKRFENILDIKTDTLSGRNVVLLLDMRIESADRPFEGVIVAEVFDQHRKNLIYEAIDLDQLRPEWSGNHNRLHHVLVLGLIPENARSLLVYAWNKRGSEYTLKEVKVTATAIE